jgi:hypothetical protein
MSASAVQTNFACVVVVGQGHECASRFYQSNWAFVHKYQFREAAKLGLCANAVFSLSISVRNSDYAILVVRSKSLGAIEKAANGCVDPCLAWVGGLQLDASGLITYASDANQLACWDWQINVVGGG